LTFGYVTIAIWVIFEQTLRIRDAITRQGTAQDRGTRLVIIGALAVTIVLAVVLSAHTRRFLLPGGFRIAGLVLMWIGLLIRGWTVLKLGRSFRTTVRVDAEQAVVNTGPYRWVRHPSYLGLILILFGFGLTLRDWVSALVCLLLPLPAFLWRIHVEEATLTSVLGDVYADYRKRTKRLIPRVW
jgi:protein-S-isoprenylcysteine O-methyltransferase Ste14